MAVTSKIILNDFVLWQLKNVIDAFLLCLLIEKPNVKGRQMI